MRGLRRLGALFSQDAFGYWRALYVFLLVVWSVSIIWMVASGSLLETPDTGTTVIKIGLLEAVAFVAAWSLLLITLNTKIVNKGRDLEYAADESNRKLDEMKAEVRQHNQDHAAVVERLDAKFSQSANMMEQLVRENEQVAEENERLRRQLEARATKERGND